VTRLVLLRSTELDEPSVRALRDLWDLAFDGDFDETDAAHAFGGVHALVRSGSTVLSHACLVPRSLSVGDSVWRCGYVEGVATLPEHQGRGLGSQTMQALDPVLRRDYDMGALSTGAHRFYERLGWERWRGPSYVLRNGERLRTEDEDDGLMVLRFGPSADLDRTLPIACEDRPGDAW